LLCSIFWILLTEMGYKKIRKCGFQPKRKDLEDKYVPLQEKKGRGTYTPVYNRDSATGRILPPKSGLRSKESQGVTGSQSPRTLQSKESQGINRVSGNQSPRRTIRRFSKPFHDLVTVEGTKDEPYKIPDADGRPGSAMILRPKKPVTQSSDMRKTAGGNYPIEEMKGNILVHKTTLMDHINSAIKMHEQERPECDNLNLDLVSFLKWGYSWRAKVTCKSCGFTSKRCPLYEQIPKNVLSRGPKKAKVTQGMMIGIQETSIGPERFNFALAHGGLASASHSTCQAHANQASDMSQELNKKDIGEKIELVKDVMEARGFDRDAPIAAQFDAQYNGPMKTRSHPGHGSHSAQGLTLENVTSKHFIIGRYISNKHCSSKKVIHHSPKKVSCPGKNGRHGKRKCTATMGPADLFDEGNMTKEMARSLKEDHNVRISHMCTDSDGKGIEGFREVMGDDVIWQKDLVHLTKSQMKAVQNASFSANMFGDMKGPQKIKAQQALANDLPERVAIMHNKLHKTSSGVLSKMQQKAKGPVEGVLRCYAGDHRKCTFTPLVQDTCGGVKGRTWFHKSQYLSAQGISSLNMTVKDRAILRRIIEMKLGEDGLRFTYRRATTQAVESAHCTTRVSLPQKKMFRRNIFGRVDGACLRRNNGPKESSMKKLHMAKCEVAEGSPAMKRIQHQQRILDYNREYSQRPSSIKQRQLRSAAIKKEFFDSAKKRHNKPKYLAGLLEEEILVHGKAVSRQKARFSSIEDTILDPQPSTSQEVPSVKQARQKVETTWRELEEAKIQRQKENLAKNIKKQNTSKLAPIVKRDHYYTRGRYSRKHVLVVD